jgi:hypothetical protein
VLGLREDVPAGWTVVFRPHPQERTLVAQRYGNLLGAAGVRVDDEPDPYRSFGRARVIVGSKRTSLFEAIALHTPVVIRETSMSGDYMDPAIFNNRIKPGEDAAPRSSGRSTPPSATSPPTSSHGSGRTTAASDSDGGPTPRCRL